MPLRLRDKALGGFGDGDGGGGAVVAEEALQLEELYLVKVVAEERDEDGEGSDDEGTGEDTERFGVILRVKQCTNAT